MTLRLGLLVMVVGTRTPLDGATGTVVELERWGIGWSPFLLWPTAGKFWGVHLSRTVAGSPMWYVGRQYLLPLQPPEGAEVLSSDMSADAPTQATA